MAAVVNVLQFKGSVDPEVFAKSERDLLPQMRVIEGFQGFDVVQTSGTEVIFIILGEPVEVLDQFATEVGSRWMRSNVVPLLAGLTERDIAPVIASSGT
jgi:hypothetical protein